MNISYIDKTQAIDIYIYTQRQIQIQIQICIYIYIIHLLYYIYVNIIYIHLYVYIYTYYLRKDIWLNRSTVRILFSYSMSFSCAAVGSMIFHHLKHIQRFKRDNTGYNTWGIYHGHKRHDSQQAMLSNLHYSDKHLGYARYHVQVM